MLERSKLFSANICINVYCETPYNTFVNCNVACVLFTGELIKEKITLGIRYCCADLFMLKASTMYVVQC